jgi:hypothetical protein
MTPTEQLISDLARPTLIYRLANGRVNTGFSLSIMKSGEITRDKALKEIDDIVRAYVIANPGIAE